MSFIYINSVTHEVIDVLSDRRLEQQVPLKTSRESQKHFNHQTQANLI